MENAFATLPLKILGVGARALFREVIGAGVEELSFLVLSENRENVLGVVCARVFGKLTLEEGCASFGRPG